MQAWAGIISALRFNRNADIRKYDEWIPVMERLLAEDPTFPSEEVEYQVAEGMVRAMYWRRPWHPDNALSARERLRAKFIRHIGARAKASMQKGRWEDALDCYQRGLEADDLAEEFYRGSMGCYQQLDRRAEALAVYRRMRQTLRSRWEFSLPLLLRRFTQQSGI